VTTDRGSEFIGETFRRAVRMAGGQAAGDRLRPTTVPRLRRARAADDHRGVLATVVRALARPKLLRPARGLERYVRYFNYERAHLGRRTNGRTPPELVYGARKMDPRLAADVGTSRRLFTLARTLALPLQQLRRRCERWLMKSAPNAGC